MLEKFHVKKFIMLKKLLKNSPHPWILFKKTKESGCQTLANAIFFEISTLIIDCICHDRVAAIGVECTTGNRCHDQGRSYKANEEWTKMSDKGRVGRSEFFLMEFFFPYFLFYFFIWYKSPPTRNTLGLLYRLDKCFSDFFIHRTLPPGTIYPVKLKKLF